MKSYLRNWMGMNDQVHNPGKESPVPIGQEAGWAPEPVWRRCQREEIHYHPCRGLKPGYPTGNIVTILTELLQLPC